MRTPPMPGRYTPGSTVTTWPGAKRIIGPSTATRGCLVDLEADAVAGAVHERVAPPGVGDDARGTRGRRPRTSTPARDRVDARLLALAHDDLEHRARASGPGSPTLTVRVMSEQ